MPTNNPRPGSRLSRDIPVLNAGCWLRLLDAERAGMR